jgi:hypothetical protein
VAPRTLVLTQDEIIMCDEDHLKYPIPNFPGVIRPKTPHFTLVQKRKISDVVSVELSDEEANYFKLVFEEDDKTKGYDSTWQIYTQHPAEAKKFLKNLAKLWQELFQVPLIKELGSGQ